MTCEFYIILHAARPDKANPPTVITGPIHPPVAAVSVPPSTKNFAAQAAMQEPWAVLHAKAAAGKAAPPVVQLLQHYMPSGRHRSSPMKPYSSLLQIYRRKMK